MTNDEKISNGGHGGLVIRGSTLFRHSSFGFRHSPNTHPAYTASHSSVFQRIHSLARRFCRPAPARFCAALHRHPWPSGAHRHTRKSRRRRRRSTSKSRPHFPSSCVGRRSSALDRVTRRNRVV